MRAFHSTWTKPYPSNRLFKIDDFELLTTMLSALKWRQLNGSIEMVTDERGAKYYEEIGLTPIWDEGIRVRLDEIPDTINPDLFWAAGKIYALKEQSTPCVMIDTDFIVWEEVVSNLKLHEVAVIHGERLEECVYPNKEFFDVCEAYTFPTKGWDELACNTAFTYIADVQFKHTYVNHAIDFMEGVRSGKDKITNMVFAEQRMLALVAKECNIPIHYLMSLETLIDKGKQQTYTHIWGYKQRMRDNSSEREAFCKRCIHRIQTDFPEFEDLVWRIPGMEKYE